MTLPYVIAQSKPSVSIAETLVAETLVTEALVAEKLGCEMQK